MRPAHDSILYSVPKTEAVFLGCTCGWKVSLGSFTKLKTARTAWHLHLKEVGAQ